MPGETYNTLKERYTKQTGSSTQGTAMANQAAQAGGASQEFFGSGKGAKKKHKEVMHKDDKGNFTAISYPNLSDKDKEKIKKEKIISGTADQQTYIDAYKSGLDEDYEEETLLNKIFGNEIMRLTPSQLRRVKKILAEYQKLGIKNPAKLRALMGSNIMGGIFGQDQTFSDMEGNIIKQDDIIFQDGKMFFKGEDGELKPVRRTKEGTIDLLKEEGSDIMKSLKKFHPELYYPFMGQPGTTGGLANLANLPTSGDNAVTDPELRNMIFNARQELDKQGRNYLTGNLKDSDRYRQNGGGNFGGGGIGDIPTTDPTTLPTPDYYLRKQYMPQNVTGFTPDYTGGPEQMQIAGGWWDPTGKKWLGSPWGTQNQFQFNQGGIVGTNPLLFKNQGGMASDSGIKSFKKYGY